MNESCVTEKKTRAIFKAVLTVDDAQANVLTDLLIVRYHRYSGTVEIAKALPIHSNPASAKATLVHLTQT